MRCRYAPDAPVPGIQQEPNNRFADSAQAQASKNVGGMAKKHHHLSRQIFNKVLLLRRDKGVGIAAIARSVGVCEGSIRKVLRVQQISKSTRDKLKAWHDSDAPDKLKGSWTDTSAGILKLFVLWEAIEHTHGPRWGYLLQCPTFLKYYPDTAGNKVRSVEGACDRHTAGLKPNNDAKKAFAKIKAEMIIVAKAGGEWPPKGEPKVIPPQGIPTEPNAPNGSCSPPESIPDPPHPDEAKGLPEPESNPIEGTGLTMAAWFDRVKADHKMGWLDGVHGNPVSATFAYSLSYVEAWTNGRRSYNKNVHDTDNGTDPMPD